MAEHFVSWPTYIVGLGGSGVKVLRRLKAKYEGKFRTMPKTIGLLGIDTDAQKDNMPGEALGPKEFLHLEVSKASKILSDLNSYPRLREWWKYERDSINPIFVLQGAGALRPVGRLALFQNFSRVYESLANLVDEPWRYRNQIGYPQDVKRACQAFVVGSVAGGTGTGMFIDTGFILRQLVGADLNRDFYMNSVLVMPSVFDTVVAGAARTRHLENAAAALTELDYFQTRPKGTDIRPINFGRSGGGAEREVEVKKLFDWNYLVGRRGKDGVLFNDPEEIYDRIAEFIFSKVALTTGQEAASFLDNQKWTIDPAARAFSGVHGIYSTFAVEVTATPSTIKDTLGEVAAGAAKERLLNPSSISIEAIDARLNKRIDGLAALLKLEEVLADASAREMLLPEFDALRSLESPEDVSQAVDLLHRERTRYRGVVNSGLGLKSLDGIADDLAKFVDDVMSDSLHDADVGLRGAQRIADRLREHLARLQSTKAPVEAGGFDQAIEQARKSKNFIGMVDKAKLRRNFEAGNAAIQAEIHQQVVQRILETVRRPLSSAIDSADAWSKKLRLACERLEEAASSAEAAYRDSAKKADSSGQQATFSSSVVGERALENRATLGDQVVRAALKVGDADVEALVHKLASADEWRVWLRRNVDAVVQDRRGDMFGRQGRMRELQDNIISNLKMAQPLAFLDQHVGQYREEQGVVRAPAVWLIATNNKGVDIELEKRLEAEGHSRKTEAHEKPQIVDNGDPDRDEVFVEQHGLFLDTLLEVRDAERALADLPQKKRLERFVYLNIPGVPQHKITPVPQAELDGHFAVAVVTGAIYPEGPSVKFKESIFGRQFAESDGADWTVKWERAEKEFRSDPAYSSKMREWIVLRAQEAGDNKKLREALLAVADKFQAESAGEPSREPILRVIDEFRAFAGKM